MDANRNLMLAANWKLNNQWEDCEQFILELRSLLPDYFQETIEPAVELVLCPAFPYVGVLGSLLEDGAILTGAQNTSEHKSGAFTGEVSAAMLADSGCDFCIVGHSERRNVFGESNELVAAKLRRLSESEIVPVLCVGESLDVREAGNAGAHVMTQLEAVKAELGLFEPGDLVVAYEPVWAIGTGKNATADDATAMAAVIRNWISGSLGAQMAAQTQILYGGSVKPENINLYVGQGDIDGALIGGASLRADSFAAMVSACLAD